MIITVVCVCAYSKYHFEVYEYSNCNMIIHVTKINQCIYFQWSISFVPWEGKYDAKIHYIGVRWRIIQFEVFATLKCKMSIKAAHAMV